MKLWEVSFVFANDEYMEGEEPILNVVTIRATTKEKAIECVKAIYVPKYMSIEVMDVREVKPVVRKAVK